MKKFNASFKRRIATVLLLAGITATFLSVYYFVYLPKQRVQFNASTFRLLNNITSSFTERVANYGDVKKYKYISIDCPDDTIRIPDSMPSTPVEIDSFNKDFIRTFYKSKGEQESYHVQSEVKNDFIKYIITDSEHSRKKGDPDHKHRDSISFRELLAPLTAIYKKTFAGIFLFRQNNGTTPGINSSEKPDLLIYKPDDSELNIGDVYTDSLFPDKSMQVPVVIDTRIDDIPFKFFLVPFKIPTVDSGEHTFVMTGLMEMDYYNSHIQDIPAFLLVGALFVIAILLLALPFLKIFLIGSKESLKTKDIRSIIAVVFIIPFFVTIVAGAIWIYHTHNNDIQKELSHLNTRVSESFYMEIAKSLKQQSLYDTIIKNPFKTISEEWKSYKNKKNDDPKDKILHPELYKNFTNLHWINYSGFDIAVWNMPKRPATYFNVSTRPYFLDVKYRRLRVLPFPFNKISNDSFAIQPLVSRLTGEYTISVSKKSKAEFDTISIVSGISSKMYSVFNPVLADGYAFCMIDSSGLVVCHSDTARSLQENIFKESRYNYALKNAVNHKDSAVIDGLVLNDQPVKLLIKPMPGLPYYLITYYQSQKKNLFVFHVIGFAFVSELLLLILASIFAYFIMLSNKKVGRLSFEPTKLNWLKPTPSKIDYYIKNVIQLLACLFLISIFSLFYNDEANDVYWLNVAVLLPLYVVLGYYLIKNAKAYADNKNLKPPIYTRDNFFGFIRFAGSSYLIYALFVLFYVSVQDRFFYNEECKGIGSVKTGIAILCILVPAIATCVAGLRFGKIEYIGYLNSFIISLVFASFTISVVPTLVLLNYGYKEEENLLIQTLQIDSARKIQQRRARINSLMWQTKLDMSDEKDKLFIKDMKFNTCYGIYPARGNIVSVVTNDVNNNSNAINCSPYFRIITQALFLPPEHDDFYDDTAHQSYYHWSASNHSSNGKRKISLFYKNTTDFRDQSSNIRITTNADKKFIFQKGARSATRMFPLLCVFVFGLLFYKLIASVTKRIFLLDYFSRKSGNLDFERWLDLRKNSFASSTAYKKAAGLIGLHNGRHLTFDAIRKKELDWISRKDNAEELILELHLVLAPVFEEIWKELSDTEKYVLYDFATDGFTNYKNILVLNELYDKGLLVKEEDATRFSKSSNLTFMSMAFRNFLLTKENSEEIAKQTQENKSGSWSTVRLVFIMVLIAFAVFLLITQQEATQRIVTIVTTLGTLLPLMLRLFDTSSSGAAAKKQ